MNEQIKKKAIEKMSKDICPLIVSCDECMILARKAGQSKEQYCKAMQYAKRAVEKGYCKHNEGKWKKVSEKSPRYKCTICNHLYNNTEYKYCPFCGAKMKGGAE